ncbi:MAG: RIP metalloprotease RseP [Minisyncoccia bacterium]
MTIIIFLVILAVLVFVHELGHFVVAKKSGVRVDEFAVGFPPTLYRKKVGETTYKLNAIPFGGYVKIHGETPDDDTECGVDNERSFTKAKKWKQALIISSGVLCNFLIAWPLFTASFMTGVAAPAAQNYEQYSSGNLVMIVSVEKNSPAEKAGFERGDEIVSIKTADRILEAPTVDSVQNFIKEADGELAISVIRSNEPVTIFVTPVSGVVEGKKAVGIMMSEALNLRLPFHLAAWEGLKYTILATKAIFVSLYSFIGQAFIGQADYSQISGPVGIVGMVGSAKAAGWSYVISFAAMISINLAVLNLVPFPALDGGRLLFIGIEAIIRRPLNPKWANRVNAVGFMLLILLMIVISVKDILKLI